jgi:hypothetical protein
MNLIPAKNKKKSQYIESSESESDTDNIDNNQPSNNYNSGHFSQ